MSTEPQSNLEPESSFVEETIPPFQSGGVANADAEGAEGESGEAVRPLTPQEMDRHECRACGYTYEPAKGDSRSDVPPGIAFEDLPPNWRCPVCGASTRQFSNVGPLGTASGFKENLNYGFGVNTLTPGQKSILIFGALGIAVLFFLSLYGLR